MAWIEKIVAFFDCIAKVVAGVAGIILVGSYFCPSVTSYFERLWAERFSISGFVYYEVTSEGGRTTAGNLALLKTGPRDFKSLQTGDKLQAQSTKNLRNKPSKADGISILVVPINECLIVLDKEQSDDPFAGWLKAAKIDC